MTPKTLYDTLLRLPGSSRLKELDFLLRIMRFDPNLPLLTRGAGRDECVVVVDNGKEKMDCIRRSPHIQFVTLSELPTHFIRRKAVPIMVEQHALESVIFGAARDLQRMSRLAELVPLWHEYEQSTREAVSRLPVRDKELVNSRADQINALLESIAREID